jgi:hypothetical protein
MRRYRGQIAVVRDAAANLKHADARLRWLPAEGLVALTETAALIGHDGWADGRCGDFRASRFRSPTTS